MGIKLSNPPTPIFSLDTGFPVIVSSLPEMDPGYNRCDELGSLHAQNDLDAARLFLAEFTGSPNTLRSYTLALERFILWLLIKKKKPISAADRADRQAFIDFLADPTEQQSPNITPTQLKANTEFWCSETQEKKFDKSGAINPKWRPFTPNRSNKNQEIQRKKQAHSRDAATTKPELIDYEFGLLPSSQTLSIKILESFFAYLVEHRYLYSHPFFARRTKGQKNSNKKQSLTRYLEDNEVLFVAETIDERLQLFQQDTVDYFQWLRAKYIFLLYVHTGLRISEPVHYTMADIKEVRSVANPLSTFHVINVSTKGMNSHETRSIAIGQEFISVLEEFKDRLQSIANQPIAKRSICLIPKLTKVSTPEGSQYQFNEFIGERRISAIFRTIFNAARARSLSLADNSNDHRARNTHIDMAMKFEQATCHWLRHTHATIFLRETGDLKLTQDRLGHASVNTTMIYLHTDNDTLHKHANAFKLHSRKLENKTS